MEASAAATQSQPTSSNLTTGSMSSPASNSSLPFRDPRFQRYYQAVRNAEVSRQYHLWLSQGASEESARRNAQMYVQRELDGNAAHSLYLYMAAMRAMQTDAASGNQNFAGAVAQAVLEYSSMIAAEQMTTQLAGGAVSAEQQMQRMMTLVSSALSGQVPTFQVPPQAAQQYVQPRPPPPPATYASIPRTSLRFGAAAAASPPPPPVIDVPEIPIPSSSQATRLMGQRWVKATYQSLARTPPPDFSGTAHQWTQAVYAFCRLVVEGMSRHPEEGSALRWLTLPQPDAALVLRVAQNPEAYRNELPGYFTSPAPLAAEQAQVNSGKRATMWVPPVSAVETSRSRSSSLSSLSSSSAAKGSSAKRRRVEIFGSPTTAFIPLPERLPAAFNRYNKHASSKAELAKRKARLQRFNNDFPPSSSPAAAQIQPMTWREKLAVTGSTQTVVGRSTALEKAYLRLCGPPDPALVRTESALHESFFHVTSKFLHRATREERGPYHFIDEQLRSIRQDFVVQGLQTPFLYFVYCVNARISLMHHDLGQFNQCQSQLKNLEKILPDSTSDEMLVQRLLYAAVNNLDADFAKLQQSLTTNQENNYTTGQRWAFRARKALQEQNYSRFMKLAAAIQQDDEIYKAQLEIISQFIDAFKTAWQQQQTTEVGDENRRIENQMNLIRKIDRDVWGSIPTIGGVPYFCSALISVALPRIRMQYLVVLSKAHYKVSVSCIQKWLCYSSREACLTFLQSQNAIFADSDDEIDCKLSYPIFLQSPLLSRKIKAMG